MSYNTQFQDAQNLLGAYLAVKDNFDTFVRSAQALCPDLMRVSPGSSGREIFADVIRLDQCYWDDDIIYDDGSSLIRCENIIVTTTSDGFVELDAYENSEEAQEVFSQAKYLIDYKKEDGI